MGLTTKHAAAKAWLRLGAYVALLHVIAGVGLMTVARARTDAALSRFGQLVMDYAEATHQQAPRTVVINGAHLQLSVGASKRSVSEVLDHFQRRCASRSGGFGEQLQDALIAASQAQSVSHAAVLDGSYRIADETHGVVACLDTGRSVMSMEELARRAQRVTESGDLSQLGHLRFVSAERGDQRTVFVAMWTEGAINLRHMFPGDGDAPGVDHPGVPRPAGARRVLSAWEHGQDKAVNAYRVGNTSPTVARQHYIARLRADGFALLGDPNGRADGTIAQRGQQYIAATFSPADETSTLVTISSLGGATEAVTLR